MLLIILFINPQVDSCTEQEATESQRFVIVRRYVSHLGQINLLWQDARAAPNIITRP